MSLVPPTSVQHVVPPTPWLEMSVLVMEPNVQKLVQQVESVQLAIPDTISIGITIMLLQLPSQQLLIITSISHKCVMPVPLIVSVVLQRKIYIYHNSTTCSQC